MVIIGVTVNSVSGVSPDSSTALMIWLPAELSGMIMVQVKSPFLSVWLSPLAISVISPSYLMVIAWLGRSPWPLISTSVPTVPSSISRLISPSITVKVAIGYYLVAAVVNGVEIVVAVVDVFYVFTVGEGIG